MEDTICSEPQGWCDVSGAWEQEADLPTAARRLARAGGPVESAEAAESVLEFLGKMQERVLELVVRRPGLTAEELSRAAGEVDPRRVNRRLPELERLGLVNRGDPRPGSSGRRCATWWPTEGVGR